MGSSSSKLAKTASPIARRYPATSSLPKSTNTLPTEPSSTETRSGPIIHPKSTASTSRDEHIELDARDPDFGSRLSQLGPVQPAPTYSHSSTFTAMPQVVKSSPAVKPANSPSSGRQVVPSISSNPALLIVQARDRLARVFEEESESLGRASFKGRSLISAAEIKNVLSMRDDGKRSYSEIEKQLRLRQGLLGKLGPNRVVENA